MESNDVRSLVQRVGPGSILGLWLCVPNSDAVEIRVEVIRLVRTIGIPEGLTIDMICDRLYGGFACEDKSKRHVYFNAGQFSYLRPNYRLFPAVRAACFAELIAANKDNYIGDGPFSDGAPEPQGEPLLFSDEESLEYHG